MTRDLYPLLRESSVQVIGGAHDGTTFPVEEIAQLQVGGFVKMFDPRIAVAEYVPADPPSMVAALPGVTTYELKLERLHQMAEVRPILVPV